MSAAAPAHHGHGRHGNHSSVWHAGHVRRDDPPPPVFAESYDRPVCLNKPWTNESCAQTRFNGSTTFGSYAMPRGMRHFTDESGLHMLNRELGRSHSWLPVSHTHTQQHAWQPGLWFYYVRGCSDFEWDMGRTLLVRNRCHLAGVLEQRAHRVGWAHAIGRVARKLVLAGNVSAWAPQYVNNATMRSSYGPGGMIIQPLAAITARRTEAEIAAALDLCARGMILPKDHPDRELFNLAMDLWSLNTLDYTSGATIMHDLHGTPEELDTIQIANQCSPDNNHSDLASDMCHQAVELWDVRAIGASWRMDINGSSSIPRPWRAPNGSQCELSKAFPLCMACHDSMSERSCRYKCSRSRHIGFVPQGTSASEMAYGVTIRPEIISRIAKQGALGKSEMWRFVWERVVRNLPRLDAL